MVLIPWTDDLSGKSLPSRSPQRSRAQRGNGPRNTLQFNIRPANSRSIVRQLSYRASADTSTLCPVKKSTILAKSSKDASICLGPLGQPNLFPKVHSISPRSLKQQSLPQCFFDWLSLAAAVCQSTERAFLHFHKRPGSLSRFRRILFSHGHASKHGPSFVANPHLDTWPKFNHHLRRSSPPRQLPQSALPRRSKSPSPRHDQEGDESGKPPPASSEEAYSWVGLH